jgi:hypothetical protein
VRPPSFLEGKTLGGLLPRLANVFGACGRTDNLAAGVYIRVL